MSDEIIEELWGIKSDIAREHGGDVRRLAIHLQSVNSPEPSSDAPQRSAADMLTETPAQRPARAGERDSAAHTSRSRVARSANRRPPAVLDPVALATHGEDQLRAELAPLTIDQLKDIVADYGMDRDSLAMRWKIAGRVIDRIVEVSMSRARKGSAFLGGIDT